MVGRKLARAALGCALVVGSAVMVGSTVVVGPAPVRAAAGDYWVVGGDQGTGQLVALDPAVADWSTAAAVKWTWQASTARGFSAAEVAASRQLTDFKLRDSVTGGGQRFVVAAGSSSGLAAVVNYPGGTRVWARVLPGNVHSAELLPDGNVAVAASDGNWVRVYASSQGPNAASYAQYDLKAAHATLWDPAVMRLWVIGQDPTDGSQILTALRVGGTPAKPVLREDTARRRTLPSAWGHDVSPYLHDAGKLWVSTQTGEYLFDKASGAFTTVGTRTFVKAVSNQPSGQRVETKADATKAKPGACATVNDWCTDTVDFFGPDATRRRPGAQFYKARVWSPYYGAVDRTLHGTVQLDTRAADGAWSGPAPVDGNASITRVAGAALPDGTLHVLTLVPGSGVWDRTRTTGGTWTGSTKIDSNGAITALSAAALPDGTLHVQTLVPGSGIWDRTRTTTGTWTGSTKIDDNGAITALSAAALPDGTLHVQTLVPGSGIWDRTRTTTGTWTSSTRIDDNGAITALSAAALPDGTLHVQTLVPGSGI
ncbi:DUF6528 family protein, partial [Micromonospora sp. NPDC049559]|uniref:DUF6528 family protein n=1 Tax=Micromonospora sp. NPDC049559 TaxID=3155923 RepID=UPI0034399639